MGDHAEFSYEASGSRRAVAASLRAVAAHLSGTGPITLTAGDQRVTVTPGEDVEFEVEVEREATDRGDAVELEFELEWSEPSQPTEPPETRQTTDSPPTTDSADAPGQADAPEEANAPGGSAGEADARGRADDEADAQRGADDGGDSVAEAPGTVDFDAVDAPDATAPKAVESAGSQATFEVFRDTAGEWRWRLVHRNGNVVATSGEGYTRRRNAEKGLRSVVTNAPGAEVVDDLQ